MKIKIFAYNINMKYCIECGTQLVQKECINFGISDGLVPYCPYCKEFRFPMYNVAVSAVIFNPDYSKILLIQQYGRPRNILVAGYVNRGENLSYALVREIKEEVNLAVKSYKFNESEYYKGSNTLICNFIVQAENEDFSLSQEVDGAEWFNIETAKDVVYKGGLAEEFLNKAVSKVITVML